MHTTSNSNTFTVDRDLDLFIDNYILYLYELMKKLDKNEIKKYIEELQRCYSDNNTMFIIGNGGSASASSHIANDVNLGITKKSNFIRPFKAHSLTDNMSVITAIANDLDYDDIFVQQLRMYYQEGDILLAISASGNSPNIIRAVEWVKSHGGKVISFVGFDGGKLKVLSDIVVHINSLADEYGPVEDIQLIINHLTVAWLQNEILNNFEV
ncbi:Phosphoheptose isomerase [compost metagenome]